MNVTCERCSTEYEFEETLVSHRGTTVKCTSCGHLFKIYRPEPQPSSDSVKPWMLRRHEGGVEPLASVGELARMIANGRTGPDDEISRGGMGWKRLGDIQELAGFFQAARSPQQDARHRNATPALGLHARPEAPSSPTEEADPTEEAGEPDETVITNRLPAVEKPRENEARNPRPSDGSATQQDASARPAPRTGLLARLAGRHWVWVALAGGAVAVAIMGWLAWPRPHAEPATAVEPATDDGARVRRFLAKADAALASDRIEQFDQALIEYAKALALRDDDPHILASLSRVHALWAQSLLDRTYTTPSPREAASDSQDPSNPEQARHVREAKRHAEQALDTEPGHAEAHIAMADALRLSEKLSKAREHMKRARTGMPGPTAEGLRVRAWIEVDAAGGDLAAGTELARKATRLAPDMLRVRKLLARCLMAEGELQGARNHLEAVLARDPGHEEARALLERLDSIAGASAADADAATTPSRSNADGPASPGRTKRRAGGAATGRGTPEAAPASDVTPTYGGYVEHAGRLLERGSVSRAKQYYRKALGIQGGGSEALAGLGYIALERGAPQAALARFKQAAAKEHPDAYLGLGETYRRLGRKQDALDAYEHYMRLDPRGRGSSVARHQIERLRAQLENEATPSVSSDRVQGRFEAPSRTRAKGHKP